MEENSVSPMIMAAISARALESNRTRATVIHSALLAARQGALREEQQRGAQQAAHQVAGSAGTFGYIHASEIAAGLENYLRAFDARYLPAAIRDAETLMAELADR